MKKILLILVFFFVVFGIDAATPGASFAAKPQAGFTENKGQIVDQNRQQNKDVLFLLNSNGLNVQIRKGGFSYDTYTIERKAKEQTQDKYLPKNVKNVQDSFDFIYHYHRVDIDFENANKLPEVKRGKALLDYLNYYNVPNVPEGVVNVYSYKSILVKNIYPGIDIEYLVDAEKGFKYNFIVHPGADFHLIQMKYAGAESKLIENKIELSVDAGKLQEDIPQSWLADDKAHLVNVGYKQIAKGVFGFEMDAPIASNKTLIIDPIPNVVWATYYGYSGFTTGESCDVDASGNLLFSSHTNSTSFVATAGSFQVSLAGQIDIILAKFNSTGVRLWATYYGGINYETQSKCKLDLSGNCYLAGQTSSFTNISLNGSHQVSFGGGSYDLFLVKLSSNGLRVWATYYGGEDDEDEPNLALDSYGNAILSGTTLSNTNISTVGAFQASNAGSLDLFLVKFNPLGVRLWATYFGDKAAERNPSCVSDTSGNIILVGISPAVTSVNTVLATIGAHQTTSGGINDAIIVKFNSIGVRLWSTYYGGTGDEGYSSCSIDLSGNILILSRTNSVNAIATNGAHQLASGGDYDCFLVKFNSAGVRLWGSYYGGESLYDFPKAIETDPLGNVYITGYTYSKTNFSTIGSFQESILGNSDGFLVKFNPNGVRQYGTYFGGTGQDYVYNITLNSIGVIYLIGTTNSSTNIATSGSYQSTLIGYENAFLARFSECVIGNIGAISPVGIANTCIGISKTFSVMEVAGAIGYNWTVPAGWFIQSGQGSAIIKIIPYSSGKINVQAFSACGDSTVIANYDVITSTNANPSAIAGDAIICYGVVANYSVISVAGNTYEWVLPNSWVGSSITNSILINSFLTPVSGGDSIFVRAINTANTCPSAYIKKRVDCQKKPVIPSVLLGVNPSCKNLATVFSVDSLPYANSYSWTFPAGWTVDPINNLRQISVTPTINAIAGDLTVKGNNATCGSGAIYTKALLAPVSIPNAPNTIVGNSNVCSGSTQTYTVSAIVGASYYRWELPLNWIINSGQGSTSITVKDIGASGNISVYASAAINSCESGVKTFPVNVSITPPTPIISANLNPCLNQNAVFTVTNAAGASVIWTAPAGWTISNQNQASTNILIAGYYGNISAKLSNGTCDGPIGNIAISAITSPNILEILGEKYVKGNSVRNYNVAALPSTNYTWTIPLDWHLLSGNNSGAITVMTGNTSGQITVTGQNSCGTSSPFAMNVYAGVSAGMDEFEVFGDLKVYPQPAKDFFKLKFTSLKQLDHPKIILVEMLGKVVFTRFEPTLVNGQTYEGTFSCEGLTPGVYFLQIQANNFSQSIKFLISPQ